MDPTSVSSRTSCLVVPLPPLSLWLSSPPHPSPTRSAPSNFLLTLMWCADLSKKPIVLEAFRSVLTTVVLEPRAVIVVGAALHPASPLSVGAPQQLPRPRSAAPLPYTSMTRRRVLPTLAAAHQRHLTPTRRVCRKVCARLMHRGARTQRRRHAAHPRARSPRRLPRAARRGLLHHPAVGHSLPPASPP